MLFPKKEEEKLDVDIGLSPRWWATRILHIFIIVFRLDVPASGPEDIRAQFECVFTLKKLTLSVFHFVQLYPQDGGGGMSVSSC